MYMYIESNSSLSVYRRSSKRSIMICCVYKIHVYTCVQVHVHCVWVHKCAIQVQVHVCGYTKFNMLFNVHVHTFLYTKCTCTQLTLH